MSQSPWLPQVVRGKISTFFFSVSPLSSKTPFGSFTMTVSALSLLSRAQIRAWCPCYGALRVPCTDPRTCVCQIATVVFPGLRHCAFGPKGVLLPFLSLWQNPWPKQLNGREISPGSYLRDSVHRGREGTAVGICDKWEFGTWLITLRGIRKHRAR